MTAATQLYKVKIMCLWLPPACIEYLFIVANAAGDVRMMQDRLTSTLQKQGLGKDEIAARLQKFHFAVAPMTGEMQVSCLALYSMVLRYLQTLF